MDTLTKLVINLDKLHQNIQKILSFKEGHFMVVLKANAYGMGYREILEELNGYEEIEFIGVALPNEAIYLRKYTNKKIVVLGYSQDAVLNKLVELNIIPTIFEQKQADLLPEKTKVFFNVDTGFHRLGCDKEEFRKLQKYDLEVVGVFTHLRLRNQKLDMIQVKEFYDTIENHNFPYVSISDSIGYTRYDLDENLYRIGAAIFGYTSKREIGKLTLEEVVYLETGVTNIQDVSEDVPAFYRSKLQKGQKVATIQIGYGDGLFRTMPKNAYVFLNGQKCNYIEIGMDQSLINVTDKEVSVGDRVLIFGDNGISLERLSNELSTNKNNILTMLSHRLVREYRKNGKVYLRTGLWEENL